MPHAKVSLGHGNMAIGAETELHNRTQSTGIYFCVRNKVRKDRHFRLHAKLTTISTYFDSLHAALFMRAHEWIAMLGVLGNGEVCRLHQE